MKIEKHFDDKRYYLAADFYNEGLYNIIGSSDTFRYRQSRNKTSVFKSSENDIQRESEVYFKMFSIDLSIIDNEVYNMLRDVCVNNEILKRKRRSLDLVDCVVINKNEAICLGKCYIEQIRDNVVEMRYIQSKRKRRVEFISNNKIKLNKII